MLERIKTPQDIKKLSIEELTFLAEDVRKRIIEVTAKNGGHVAPSLGATDIAVALLKIFDPLRNRIIWDVGHQSYAYKILTERNERFDTLRQYGGISGFNKISESKYDAFGVGHSSTSISAAVGISEAKKMDNSTDKTIAIIGDGAMTGGMAFEALNHGGHLSNKDLIVILNDNEMSISKNVGALQNYLTNMMTSRSYNRIKEQIWDLSNNLPNSIRRKFIYGAQKLEESFINILVPNILFEDLGFKYVGPIDGHDITRLVRIFHKVKHNMWGPVFIHIVTQKGKGFEFAEKNSTRFHGLGPFNMKTGETKSSNKITYSSAFGETLVQIAKNDKRIVAITAAMTDGTGLGRFAKEIPERFYDVGIAEQHAVTFAGGLAVSGKKPFVAIYSTFMQRALDQIIHDIALQNLDVVFCLDRAGIVGEDGPTHHGVFDISYLSFIPNLKILAPSSLEEHQKMINFIAENKGPFVLRYPRGLAKNASYEVSEIREGKGEIVLEEDTIAILSIGNKIEDAIAIHHLLKEKEIKSTVINMRFIKPLDTALLDLVKEKHKYVITLEDNALIGGFSSIIKSYYCNDDIKVFSFGIKDYFVDHGNTDILKEKLGLMPTQIVERILDKIK